MAITFAAPEDEAAARYVDSFEKLRDPSHNRTYSETEWIAMFQTAGLEVEHIEHIIKSHQFLAWAERQGCTPEVIQRLEDLLDQADEAVVDWLQPRDTGTPQATFINHHILIAGRKG